MILVNDLLYVLMPNAMVFHHIYYNLVLDYDFADSQVILNIIKSVDLDKVIYDEIEFNVDKEKGLVGYCDYLISFSKEQYFIRSPIMAIVEAKNENIKNGLGQCIAEMVASQIFNQQQGHDYNEIYGIVSTGTVWKFLILRENQVFIDSQEYYVNQIGVILAIMLLPIQQFLAKASL